MRAPRTPFVAATVAAALLLSAGLLQASTFRALTVGELVAEAEAVARVEVTHVTHGELGDAMVYTFARLRVLDALRGDVPQEIVVRVPGGHLDGRTIEVAGMPEFRDGYELLVFLTRWDDGAYKVLGYQQGLSEVRELGGRDVLIGGRAHGRDYGALAQEIRHGQQQPVVLQPGR